MQNGTIRKLKRQEGYGFIRCDDGQDRFFFRRSLRSGDWDALVENETEVTFDHEDGKEGKGPRAINVRVIN